jgi:hypothetical protein
VYQGALGKLSNEKTRGRKSRYIVPLRKILLGGWLLIQRICIVIVEISVAEPSELEPEPHRVTAPAPTK